MTGISFLKRKKNYRFAIYGRVASGKTCILAALAMQCISNPRRLTCTWVMDPPHLRRPSGDPETWDPRAPSSQFYHGRKWLEKSISLLNRGKLPPPNPNRAEPLRYLFHFTTPEHRTFHIELIDYSGELIDPAISDDEMARRLHQHINEMDGILVLAEAPHPKLKSHPLADELLKLEQAFVQLKGASHEGPALNIPVALLINKWDRLGKIDPDHPEKEYEKLAQFLNSKPEPPHRSLINTLRNSVSEKNFKVFPVTAFGEHEFVEAEGELRAERPLQVNPLLSFGLEDGFVWAAQRRDGIDIEFYEEEVKRRSSFCVWKTRSIFPPFHLAHTGRLLAARFPKDSLGRRKIRLAVRKISFAAAMQTLCNSALTILLLLFIEVLYDGFNYRSVVATEVDPQASSEQLKAHEHWLESYYKSPGYQHIGSHFIVLDRNLALKTLKDFRQRRDEMLWLPVSQTDDDLARITLARKYLEQFGENGRYRDIATSIITKAETKNKYLANEIYLSSIASSLETLLIQHGYTEADLNELQKRLEELPEPKALSDELFQQQRWLLDQVAQEKINLARAEGRARWVEFREKYFALMRDRKTNEAAALLIEWQPRKDNHEEQEMFKKLTADFKKRVVTLLDHEVVDRTKSQLWRQARDIITTAIEDQQLISFLNAMQIKKLQQKFVEIDEQEDIWLYDQVVKYKDRDQLNNYLKNAPLKKMQRSVLTYESYLNRIANPMEIKLSLAGITWGESCGDAQVSITLNGDTVIDKSNLTARALGRTAQVGETVFTGRLDEKARLHGIAVCNGFWGNSKLGAASWEGPVKNLNGLRLGMGSDQSNLNYMTFSLTGIPIEPELPPWGE